MCGFCTVLVNVNCIGGDSSLFLGRQIVGITQSSWRIQNVWMVPRGWRHKLKLICLWMPKFWCSGRTALVEYSQEIKFWWSNNKATSWIYHTVYPSIQLSRDMDTKPLFSQKKAKHIEETSHISKSITNRQAPNLKVTARSQSRSQKLPATDNARQLRLETTTTVDTAWWTINWCRRHFITTRFGRLSRKPTYILTIIRCRDFIAVMILWINCTIFEIMHISRFFSTSDWSVVLDTMVSCSDCSLH